MKLTASMMLTVDGVYQGPGGPRRGPTRRVRPRGVDCGLWRRGGLALPHLVARARRRVPARSQDVGDLGTVLAAPRRRRPGLPRHQRLPKYVPSTTLKDPAWQNTRVIGGDVEAAVRELKAQPGRELQFLHGSGDLLRWLLERDLVDELNLRIYPVVVGDGLRLFPEHGQTHGLTLLESRTTASGVTFQTYRPAGRAIFGTAG